MKNNNHKQLSRGPLARELDYYEQRHAELTAFMRTATYTKLDGNTRCHIECQRIALRDCIRCLSTRIDDLKYSQGCVCRGGEYKDNDGTRAMEYQHNLSSMHKFIIVIFIVVMTSLTIGGVLGYL